MTKEELTAGILESQRLAIKEKNGVHLSLVFTYHDGKEARFNAVDGKFDSVFAIKENGIETWEHFEESDKPSHTSDTVTYTTPHILHVTPFSAINRYRIEYDTLRKVKVIAESPAEEEPTA